MTVTATAHPNIALVKYWGKSDAPGNIPATPSLSVTLSGFRTETTVSGLAHGSADQITLNGARSSDAKIDGFLQALRAAFAIPPLCIVSDNNFPTASGLASSASGFAALITAINQLCALGLDASEQSEWARRASASAARSLFEGFVTLQAPHWRAEPLATADHWPLTIVVAVTTVAAKTVSSSAGMRASKSTSPYYPAWTEQTPLDFSDARSAVLARDFTALAQVAEQSCLNMHALMLATQPPLLYWQPATLGCMHAVRELRAHDVPVFFTIDAGPQVKAICVPEAAPEVARRLQNVPGVVAVHRLAVGQGPRIAA